jgi:FkbM family methyltransferase
MNDNFNPNYIVSYAQNREDVLLAGFLKDVEEGFYVDIGANHPVNDSVTNLFYKRGWSGINIEPIKALHKLLEEARPRDINLNIGIGAREGMQTLRHYKDKDGLSTFSNEMKGMYEFASADTPNQFVDESIKIKTLKSTLAQYPVKDIHFMKIDVEGLEYEVLKGNDWKKFRPWILCIEANHIVHQWESILKNNNYEEVFSDGLNKYFVAVEHRDVAENFSYPQTILAKPVLTPDMERVILGVRHEKEQAVRDLERLRLSWERVNSDLNHLHYELARSRRLKGSIKQLLRAIDNIIAVRIENLDKPKIKKIKNKLDVNTVTSADELLFKLKSYDFDKYYSERTSKRISYRLAHSIHHTATRQPVRLLRKAKLKIKDLK